MRYVSAIALVVSTSWVAACASAPPPTPSPPAPAGEYRGTISLDGATRPASLSVIEDSAGLRAILHVTDEALAFGRADWIGGTLYLGFDYRGSTERGCEGRLHLVTEADSEALALRGDLHARDCTGSARGSFDFELFSATTALRTGPLTPRSRAR